MRGSELSLNLYFKELTMKKNYKYIRGILVFFLTMVVISIFTFILVKMQPGDPAVNYLRGMHQVVTDDALERARVQLNLDKPLPVQYGLWLKKAVRGDLGISYSKKRPVIQVIGAATKPTLELGAVSFVLLMIFASLNGLLGALNHGKFWDKLVQYLSFLYVSIPVFWLGYMLILILSVRLQLLPTSGRGSLAHYLMPAICLNIPLVGQTGLFIRNVLLEEMAQPHVENAVLRGVAKKDILKNHLINNIKIPMLTVLSSNIMYVISGSILIEEVFAWPGLGRMFVGAVKTADLPLIQGSLLLFGLMAIILNGGTQVLVYRLNPRTRGGSVK